MERFPHLKFSENLIGRAKFNSSGGNNPRTLANRTNRQEHSQSLLDVTSRMKTDWTNHINERESLDLAPLNEDNKPIYFQINPDLLSNVRFDLQRLGIEIISEEEEGFILGASLDNLRSLETKIAGFVNTEYGTGNIADLWQIIDGNREQWKTTHILSPELLDKWSNIDDTQIYELEVSIAFDKPIGQMPDVSKRGGQARLEKYRAKQIERDTLLEERQSNFEAFIDYYAGHLESSFIELDDSFGCQISINGKGLKDLAINYPFVFEITEVEIIQGTIGIETQYSEHDLQLIPPNYDAPEIGVIDSGIMEGHRFLESAINSTNSKSYVTNDTTVSDQVTGGGHGTKVAGAILFPKGISQLPEQYQLPCFIRNLRVLDENNTLSHKFPAELMQTIVTENSDCKIFNLSINSTTPFRIKHMSLWASTLDKLIYEKNILFVVSAGNVSRPEIKNYLHDNSNYPDYLSNPNCRLANPAQSSFSIVVGSINHISLSTPDWESIGNKNQIAPYSRIGSGIWGHIKPDVVEYGGGLQISKNGLNNISQKDTAIELIRSNFHGGGAFNKESIGTSFATPKVTHILAELHKLYHDENINLIRALLVQGARLPTPFFNDPTNLSLKHFGYGIPSLRRVTENTEQRITFYNTNDISAEEGQIYSLKIPQALRSPGDEFDVLIEVTLAYTAKNRRTRQKTKSYLATWLEWKSSNLNDNYDSFKSHALRELDEDDTIVITENITAGTIPWKIRERDNWGKVKGINRNRSSLQKDWAVLKSHTLPEELHFAVLAHKGWDKNKSPIPYALTVSIEVSGSDLPIYNLIRIENEIEIET